MHVAKTPSCIVCVRQGFLLQFLPRSRRSSTFIIDFITTALEKLLLQISILPGQTLFEDWHARIVIRVQHPAACHNDILAEKRQEDLLYRRRLRGIEGPTSAIILGR